MYYKISCEDGILIYKGRQITPFFKNLAENEFVLKAHNGYEYDELNRWFNNIITLPNENDSSANNIELVRTDDWLETNLTDHEAAIFCNKFYIFNVWDDHSPNTTWGPFESEDDAKKFMAPRLNFNNAFIFRVNNIFKPVVF